MNKLYKINKYLSSIDKDQSPIIMSGNRQQNATTNVNENDSQEGKRQWLSNSTQTVTLIKQH